MPPNTHTLRHASAPAPRPQAPGHEAFDARLDDDSRRDEDARFDDSAHFDLAAPPDPDAPDGGDARFDEDALLSRYAALARRARALFGEPMPDPAQVPDAIVREFEDVARRLGPYVSAMPGARALSAAEFHALRAFDAMLESDEPRAPGATTAS